MSSPLLPPPSDAPYALSGIVRAVKECRLIDEEDQQCDALELTVYDEARRIEQFHPIDISPSLPADFGAALPNEHVAIEERSYVTDNYTFFRTKVHILSGSLAGNKYQGRFLRSLQE